MNEQQRRGLLALFGLTGDAAMQTVGSLSGGQRCRAALARLAGDEANFLVLDEPTNHLDLWARDALEKALSNSTEPCSWSATIVTSSIGSWIIC